MTDRTSYYILDLILTSVAKVLLIRLIIKGDENMKCKNCGGEIPDGSKVCGFCETPVKDVQSAVKEAETKQEKRIAELLKGSGCGDCHGCDAPENTVADPEAKQPHWWKEGEDCGSCGGGLTG